MLMPQWILDHVSSLQCPKYTWGHLWSIYQYSQFITNQTYEMRAFYWVVVTYGIPREQTRIVYYFTLKSYSEVTTGLKSCMCWMHFDCITMFEALYCWTSVKGGAHTRFIDVWLLNESTKCIWAWNLKFMDTALQIRWCDRSTWQHNLQFQSSISTTNDLG